jgi:hypothetical protein
MESTISSARLYYKDKGSGNSDKNSDDLNDDGSEFEIEEDELKKLQAVTNKSDQADYVVNKIQKKVRLLDFTWSVLNTKTNEYSQYLLNTHKTLFDLNKSYDTLCQAINESEQQISELNLSTQVVHEVTSAEKTSVYVSSIEKIIENLNKLKVIQINLNTNLSLIEDVKVKYEGLKAQCSTTTSTDFDLKFTNLFKRWSNLISLLNDNYTKLCGMIDMYSSGSGDSVGGLYLQLNNSVQAPWQRAVSSANKVPYYIK